MRASLAVLLVFFACALAACSSRPTIMVGAAEDAGKQQDPALAQTELDRATSAGFDTIRLTQMWTTGERALGPSDQLVLGNAVRAAKADHIRIVLSFYPVGSSVTPLTDEDRADFAAFAADAAQRNPYVHDFIVGNEPNLNRFWLPQFGPNGEDVAAPAYERLLATTYDALKAVRPHATVYGGALAPRGTDKPNTGRDTHSPTTFITDLGAAYRHSGRGRPIMDGFAFHPYPETSARGRSLPHPNSTTIGLADYAKLVGLLGVAFDGTAQHGSDLPILYDEFGVETVVPAAKATLYTGTEPVTTHPVDPLEQARIYSQAMLVAECQPNVVGFLIFHVVDEPDLSGWQSGVLYADGSPKASLALVRSEALKLQHGSAGMCPPG